MAVPNGGQLVTINEVDLATINPNNSTLKTSVDAITTAVTTTNTNLGTIADTANTDATTSGTLLAFLKGVVKILASVWDNVNNLLHTNIKRFGGATVSLGQNTGANSIPIVPPSNVGMFTKGTSYFVEGTASTLTLPGVVYTSPSTTARRVMNASSPVYLSWTVSSVAGQPVTISDIYVTVNVANATLPNGVELWLFTEKPAASAPSDNTQIAITPADLAKAIGSFAFSSWSITNNNTTVGTGTIFRLSSSNQKCTPTINGANGDGMTIYGLLVTTSAYTAAANEQWSIRFRITPGI